MHWVIQGMGNGKYDVAGRSWRCAWAGAGSAGVVVWFIRAGVVGVAGQELVMWCS